MNQVSPIPPWKPAPAGATRITTRSLAELLCRGDEGADEVIDVEPGPGRVAGGAGVIRFADVPRRARPEVGRSSPTRAQPRHVHRFGESR